MKLRSGISVWTDGARSEAATYPPLVGDARCDVLIVGGGITGSLVAHCLARDGVDALLVDRDEIGLGSTAASTGLLQYEIDEPLVDLIDQVGEAPAVRAYRLGLEAIDQIERLTVELDDSCEFARRDCLYFASHFWHARRLRREYECRRRHGFDVEYLDRRELRHVSSIDAAGAIRSRGDAQIDPLRFTRRLTAAAARNGVRVHARTRVERIDETDHGVVAATTGGTIRADRVVYATGYDIRPFLERKVASFYSTYAVAGRTGREVPGWPDACLLWETARPYFYARQTDDGRAIVGGADSAFSNDHDRDAVLARRTERLVRRFHRLFPDAKPALEFAWAGTFAATKDGLAYIGSPPERPRAFFALGYGGNGITFGVMAARLICDALSGRANDDAKLFCFDR